MKSVARLCPGRSIYSVFSYKIRKIYLAKLFCIYALAMTSCLPAMAQTAHAGGPLPIGSGFSSPNGVAVDGSGNVFVASQGNNAVYEIVAVDGVVSPSSTVKTIGSGFSSPNGVAVDASGNVFVADYNNSALYEVIAVGGVVSSSSTVNTIGSGFNGPNGLTVDGSGNVFVADYGNNAVKEIVAVGGAVSSGSTVNTLGSGFSGPTGVAVDGRGNIFVADQKNNAMKEIVTGARRLPTTAAASTSASLSIPFTFDTGGSIGAPLVLTQGAVGLDFTDKGTGSCTTNGTGHTYAAGDTCTVDVVFSPKFAGTRYGAVTLTDASGNTIATGYVYGTGVGPQLIFSPGTQSTLGSGLQYPNGGAVDGSGNVYVADAGHDMVKQIVAVGGVIPASPTINVLGSGFSSPQSVAVDGSGNVYVADTYNNAVKEIVAVGGVIPASPTIRTLGSGFNTPYGVAVAAAGMSM